MDDPTPSLSAELSAAMQWWQMAGVDCDFADDATDWLQEPESKEEVPANAKGRSGESSGEGRMRASDHPVQKSEVRRINLLGETPPETLTSFQEWWMQAPGLDAIGPKGRIAPRGNPKPKLMVLVIDPEATDRKELLSGPQGKLLSNMLSAIGISSEDTYYASALTRHTPMADTPAIAAGGMDAVTTHHINLVSPQKVIAFGTGILPLIGHSVTNPERSLREINQILGSVPLLVSEGLDSLLAMPRLKARFWRRWIECSLD